MNGGRDDKTIQNIKTRLQTSKSPIVAAKQSGVTLVGYYLELNFKNVHTMIFYGIVSSQEPQLLKL